jgi:hypothetical protein
MANSVRTGGKGSVRRCENAPGRRRRQPLCQLAGSRPVARAADGGSRCCSPPTLSNLCRPPGRLRRDRSRARQAPRPPPVAQPARAGAWARYTSRACPSCPTPLRLTRWWACSKKKAVHKTTTTDDKRLQNTLKRLSVRWLVAYLGALHHLTRPPPGKRHPRH